MNRRFFNEIVRGRYGRKVSRVNASAVDENNVVSIVGKGTSAFIYNKTAIDYLWNYYHGDQPILYRNKVIRDDVVNRIVENHAYEIVAFKVGQTYGEPVQFIARTDEDAITQAVDRLNDYVKDAHKHVRDITSGEWQSATGTSFKAVQYTAVGSDVPFRLVVPTPMNTFVVYSAWTEEPLVAVQELKDANGETYKQCFTATHECQIRNSKIVAGTWKPHAYGAIPIVEYPNNAERISDIELVITMLDAINNMQSNRMDSIEQFVQSWIKFVNCAIDKETFAEMKQAGALVVKSNNGDNKADVDIMTQELNQSESQVAKNDLWENVLTISAIPKLEGNTGGDTQGAVELRNGWDFSKSRARMKDPYVEESEKRLAKVILNCIRVRKGESECKITVRDIDVNINHSPLDNLLVKCQAMQYLLQCGVHPLYAMKTAGLWGDVEKVFSLSEPYLDKLWKSVDMDEQQMEVLSKKVDLFTKCLNSGMSIEDAAKSAKLEKIDLKADGFAKWQYDDGGSAGGEE